MANQQDKMTKNILIITIIVILVGLAVWYLMYKNGQIKNDIYGSPSPTPTPTIQGSPGPVNQLPGGLKIQDIVVGTGQEAKAGKTLSVHYVGTLEDGTKFDSSIDRGEPFNFVLGAGQVIKGWDQGFAGMKVGGKRILVIPPSLGYGSSGAGGVIPPNATLNFEVELVAVVEAQ